MTLTNEYNLFKVLNLSNKDLVKWLQKEKLLAPHYIIIRNLRKTREETRKEWTRTLTRPETKLKENDGKIG